MDMGTLPDYTLKVFDRAALWLVQVPPALGHLGRSVSLGVAVL